MTFVVGLTGGIGSGKSLAGELLADRGARIIDTDAIAHQLTGPRGDAMARIQAQFGGGVLTTDGALDRGAMRTLVFTDATARRTLEGILHPMIRAEVERQISAYTACDSAYYVVLVVPLLVETNAYRDRVNRIAVVDCSEETQIARVMARSGISRAEVERILAVQATRFQRRAVADDLIDNDGTQEQLARQIDRLHKSYMTYKANAG